MNAIEYLARVGFEYLATRWRIDREPIDDTAADEDYAAARSAADLIDHQRLRAYLVRVDRAEPRAGDMLGAKWGGIIVTWPDRVPGLKCWGGQATLPKILNNHVRRIKDAADSECLLWDVRSVYRTSKGEGPSGIDPGTCQDARDVGFSPSKLGLDIECRPGMELLAIVGLESVPLVSFAPRVCGFVHAGRVWQFTVEDREGGYSFRWGAIHEYRAEELVTA